MRNQSHKIKDELLSFIVFILLIWLVFILDLFLPLEAYGLIPRHSEGLIGIVAMPFLHGDVGHIISNTVPLFVLLTLLAGSKANSPLIVICIIVLSGILLWLFGRDSAIHIGASGLVFGLASFLIASGILEKRLIPLLISIGVGFFYGSTLLAGVLPGQKGISWDGHLMGAIAGVVVAWVLLKITEDRE
jgi:membrane associated rhomboid family serine protease